MSVLGSSTQANSNGYYFTLNNGQASSLQSPVAVTADSGGNTTLAINAGGSSGASALSVIGSAGSPGGPGTITVGGYGVVYRTAVLEPSGVLQIGLNSGSEYPVISYDSQTTHQLVLGDRSAVSSASIQTNQPLVVRDYNLDPAGINGIVMTEDDISSSTITQACASNGVLFVGSSQANKSTLVVADQTKNGAGNYIEVNGASGQVPLFISGAQGSGGASYIYPDSSGVASALFLGASRNTENTIGIQQTAEQSFVDIGGNGGQGVRLRGVSNLASVQTGIVSSTAGTSGQLQLQGSSGSANSINITDVSAVFDQQIVQQVPGTVTYSPATVLANATYSGGNTYDFNISTFATGLYMIMCRINNANITDPPTCSNLVSVMIYLQEGGSAGSTVVVGGGAGGSTNVYFSPISTGAPGAQIIRMTVVAGNLFMNVKMLAMTGILPGFNS